jgi:hypothetical protein
VTERYYRAFGERLSSSIPFPELRVAGAGPVRWAFHVVDSLPRPRDAELLGEEPLYASVAARLYRHSAGHRIVVDDTGSFDLSAEGPSIAWLPNADPWWDFGRSHFLGRVLATSLQLDGTLTLHGSAVAMADGVVGFLAPKRFGKTTLAMSLFDAGARFVTDDSLAIVAGESVLALPGIQCLRLSPAERPDAAGPEVVPGRDGKIVLPPVPEARSQTTPERLSALYFLNPVRPEAAAEPATRARVPGVPATMRVLAHLKVGRMLGSSFANALFDGVTDLAARIPIYDLAIVRDASRLPEVVSRLIDWHGLDAPGAGKAVR